MLVELMSEPAWERGGGEPRRTTINSWERERRREGGKGSQRERERERRGLRQGEITRVIASRERERGNSRQWRR